jgi:hypothetical protein
VQLKLDARHPDFTQQLFEIVYPGFLSPIPSAAIVEFVPDLEEGSLKEGVRIARGSSLRTPLSKGERTSCEFRTAHAVTMWPLTIIDARYISGAGSLSSQGLSPPATAKAALRLRLKAAPGIRLASLPLDELDLIPADAPTPRPHAPPADAPPELDFDDEDDDAPVITLSPPPPEAFTPFGDAGEVLEVNPDADDDSIHSSVVPPAMPAPEISRARLVDPSFGFTFASVK